MSGVKATRKKPKDFSISVSVCLLVRDQRFHDIVFLGLHHVKSTFDLREGKAMGCHRRRIDPPTLKQPEEPQHTFAPAWTQSSADLLVPHTEAKLRQRNRQGVSGLTVIPDIRDCST